MRPSLYLYLLYLDWPGRGDKRQRRRDLPPFWRVGNWSEYIWHVGPAFPQSPPPLPIFQGVLQGGLERLSGRAMCPNHVSLCLLTVARRGSWGVHLYPHILVCLVLQTGQHTLTLTSLLKMMTLLLQDLTVVSLCLRFSCVQNMWIWLRLQKTTFTVQAQLFFSVVQAIPTLPTWLRLREG